MVQLDLPLVPRGSVGAILEAYLREQTDGLATATMRDYRDRVAWLSRVLGESTPAAEVDTARLVRVIAAHGPTSHDGLRGVTVRRRLVFLRAAWKWAIAMGELPATALPALPRIRNDGERRRQLHTPEQHAAMLEQLPPGEWRRAAGLWFWGGLHNLDVFRARREWLDLDYEWRDESGVVVGRGRWLRHNHKNPRCTPEWFPMLAGFRAAAESWLADLPPSPSALICGRLCNPTRMFAAACVRAQVPQVAPIDYRRSCASHLLALGCSDEYARHYLGQTSPVGRDGHASARPTVLHMHYARTTPRMMLEALRAEAR